MRLANFGMIAIDGTVTRPRPGADFIEYQADLTKRKTALALQKQMSAAPPSSDLRLKRLSDSIKASITDRR